MPTYEYRCTQCEHRFDIFQRIDEEPLHTCERCGGELRKVFHPAGIVFKGSGFYATDSRRASKSSSSESSGSGSASDGGDASKKKPSEAGSSTPEKKSEKKNETKKASDSS